MTIKNRQAGLSLIEIMVALVISVFLLGGIIQVFLANKSTYRFSDAISRVQENGRFALDMITADARLGGFFGCVDFAKNPGLVQNHISDISDIYDFTGKPSIEITPDPDINGTDRLTVRGSRPGLQTLSADVPKPGSENIQIPAGSDIANNDIVLITNCWTSDIFQATGVATAAGITTISHALSANNPTNTTGCGEDLHCLNNNGEEVSHLESAYNASNSTVYELQTINYFIAPSANDANVPSLWRQQNADAALEILDNIEQLVVLRGIDTNDTDNAPNQYIDSEALLPADSVVSAIRIWLVARSDNANVLEESQVYTINNTDITATDNRMRQVFSVTIDLRNR